MAYVSKNNAYSTLAAGITNAATSLQVAAGHGDRFPVVAGSDYTYVTLEDTSGNIEIVKVTARASASDTMTIVRAQEGTTARAWNSGDVVEHRLTAGVMEAGLNAANDLTAHLNDTTAAHAASAISYAGSAGLSATDVEAALDELDSEKAAAADLTAHLNDTTAAHAASAISYAGGTGMSATDVEAAIDELATEKLNAADAFLNNVLAKTAAYTVVAADRGKLIDCDGTFPLSLTAAATLGAGFTFAVRNSGTGTITIDPDLSEQIDGATTITLAAGESAVIVCNAAAFFTVGKSTSTAGSVDTQTFTASGTWTKPAGKIALVECWGAGGSGQRVGSGTGVGGQGGAYVSTLIPLSSLGATETVTIGAGGASKTADGNGNEGGNTTFGAHLTAKGGAGGNVADAAVSAADFATGVAQKFENGPARVSGANGTAASWAGGSGGEGAATTYTGGTSFFGGAGGNGGDGSPAPTAGTAPGGGGGGGLSANSGAGAAGQCRGTVW